MRCGEVRSDVGEMADFPSAAPPAPSGGRPHRWRPAAVGRCLCGGAEIEVAKLDDTSPAQLLVCNCSMCRRASGALSLPWAAFPRANLHFVRGFGRGIGSERAPRGVSFAAVDAREARTQPPPTLRWHATSVVASRLFCSGCGASVAMDYGEPQTLWLSIGLLGDDRRFTDFVLARRALAAAGAGGGNGDLGLRYPSGHIFWESRCPLLEATGASGADGGGMPRSDEFGFYVPNCASSEDADLPNWRDADGAGNAGGGLQRHLKLVGREAEEKGDGGWKPE